MTREANFPHLSCGLVERPRSATAVRSVGVIATKAIQTRPSRLSDNKEVSVADAPGDMLEFAKVATVGAKRTVFVRMGASACVPMGRVPSPFRELILKTSMSPGNGDAGEMKKEAVALG